MDMQIATHELGKTRGRTADSQARGMDSTSTTVPPAHGLSMGTTKTNKRIPAAAAASQRAVLSAGESEGSEIFNAQQPDLAQMEREVFSSDEAGGYLRFFCRAHTRSRLAVGGGYDGGKGS